jgi:uncharacterized protein YbjT (DUF2867 family)
VRALVTGATGTVGREVCRALIEGGAQVRVGARASSNVGAIIPEVADVVPLDFAAERADPSSFEGVDALFFMTPLIDDQVAASRRLLEAAIEGGVSHVVRLSSRSVEWDEESSLRQWHRAIDDDVRASGVTWTILRPCSFFQNFIKYQAETIRLMSSLIVPQGDGLIPYVDAADIGAVAAECLTRPGEHAGETYILTGGRAYGVKGVAAEIGRVIGRPVTYISVEEAQSRDMMQEMDMPAWLVEAGLAVFAHARAGGEAAVDPALARILGRPATTLSEFVERNRGAWR